MHTNKRPCRTALALLALALLVLLPDLFLGARLAGARREGNEQNFRGRDRRGERHDDGIDARRDGRSLDEVDGAGRGRHVQVPDLELGLCEVVDHSADAHVLGARCEVAERVEANNGVRVLLVGSPCRRHAERLLAVVELEDLPTEGHACLGTKLIELVEVPLPHKGDGDPRLAGAAGPADPVGEDIGILG